ncbi:hypothetical protein N9351_04340 [Candidatus Thioglobus sp.]|nr:hypothetical protein [Candidatus Thioglobus sp.]
MALSTMTFAEGNQEKIPDITQSIESINNDILDLEVSYELDEGGIDINQDLADIGNELLYHEYSIGTPIDGNSNWNESEQMILDAKIKLQALQEKIKLEGDWGQLRVRVIDFKGEDPGQLKLRYNYGF